jgi:hypothetical protein
MCRETNGFAKKCFYSKHRETTKDEQTIQNKENKKMRYTIHLDPNKHA